MELIIAFGITWLIMRSARLVKDEWRHSRDTHGLTLARHHPDWSPGRVRRNARRRARGDWLAELRDGFPTLRRTLAEDRELARTVRAEAEAEGATRIRELRKRAKAAVGERDAALREDAGTPVPAVAARAAAHWRAQAEAEPVPAAAEPVPAAAEPAAEPGTPSPPEPGTAPAPEPAPEPGAEPAAGTSDPGKPVPAPRDSAEEDAVPADDDDSVPNPPSDETTDNATEKEGDEVTDIEDAETPYEGMQNAFQNYGDKAREIAKTAGDDLAAQAAIHGFDRDGATMADIQALADDADALVARAQSAKAGLIDRHAAGLEYHETGQDAHDSAFRAA